MHPTFIPYWPKTMGQWGEGQEPVAQGLRAAGSFSLHTQTIRGNGETKSSKSKSRKLRMISKPSSRTLGATVRLPLPARSLSLRGGRVACGAFGLPSVITVLCLSLWLALGSNPFPPAVESPPPPGAGPESPLGGGILLSCVMSPR